MGVDVDAHRSPRASHDVVVDDDARTDRRARAHARRHVCLERGARRGVARRQARGGDAERARKSVAVGAPAPTRATVMRATTRAVARGASAIARASARPTFVTTPIYYVNDQPHIGHVYTSTVAGRVREVSPRERRTSSFSPARMNTD